MSRKTYMENRNIETITCSIPKPQKLPNENLNMYTIKPGQNISNKRPMQSILNSAPTAVPKVRTAARFTSRVLITKHRERFVHICCVQLPIFVSIFYIDSNIGRQQLTS